MPTYCPHKRFEVNKYECFCCEDKMCEAFFCLVAGYRFFSDYEKLKEKLNHLLSKQDDIVIVSAESDGASKLAQQYAYLNGYKSIIFPLDTSNGRKAKEIRNKRMIEFISHMENKGIVIFDSTPSDFELAHQYNIPVRLIVV